MIKIRASLRLGLLIFSVLLFNQCHKVEASPVSENDLKAAYLIHLSEFTLWPNDKMQLPTFSICIASDSKLRLPLQQIEGHPVKNKRLEILLDVSLEHLNACHVLYVENEFNSQTFQQTKLKNDSILTVSSDENFVNDGGVIEYYPDDNRIKMRVSLKAMNQAKLQISSKLLRLMENIF